MPSESKAMVTSCVVPSEQVRFQWPLAPHWNTAGTLFVRAPMLVSSGSAGVSGGVTVQVAVPEPSGEGRVTVPESR
jgi:hypothetical protein